MPSAFLAASVLAFTAPVVHEASFSSRLIRPQPKIRSFMGFGDAALITLEGKHLESFAPTLLPPAAPSSLDGIGGLTVGSIVLALLIWVARSLPAALASYSVWARTSPYVCSISTSTVKGIFSDLFAQLVVEKKQRPSWRRTAAFSLFGAVYLGAYTQFKYLTLYARLFGAAKTAPVIGLKMLVDLAVSAPLIYFPTYYWFKGVLFGSARREVASYFSSTGWKMLTRYWAVWTPSFVVMWTLIPTYLRLPFICSISLVWQVALSTLTYVRPPTAVTHAAVRQGADANAPLPTPLGSNGLAAALEAPPASSTSLSAAPLSSPTLRLHRRRHAPVA